MRRKLRSTPWNHKLPLRAPEDIFEFSDGLYQIFQKLIETDELAFHAVRITSRGRSSWCSDRTAPAIRFANRRVACHRIVFADDVHARHVSMESWGNILCRRTCTEHCRIRHSEARWHRPDSVQSKHTHRRTWAVSFQSQSDVHRFSLVDAGNCLSGRLRVDAAGRADRPGRDRPPRHYARGTLSRTQVRRRISQL